MRPHKQLRDFDIQTNHLISARWPDLVIINKKRELAKLWTLLSRLTRVKMKESERKIRTWTLLGKTVEYESHDDTNCDSYSWYSHQRICTRSGGLGNKKIRGDHPNYWIIEIGQNTEKSPVNLRRLAVTQTPVRNYQLTLVWKARKK